MEGLGPSVSEEVAAAVAACFGTQLVSEALSSELRQTLPFATFAKVSLRCGSGLFVTDDLLQPGPILLTMVSLQSSMAGLAMREGKPVALAVSPGMAQKWQPAGDGPRTTGVVCYPVGVEAHYDGSRESYIGAVQLGLAETLTDSAHAELQGFCHSLGPYLLLVGLTKVQDMSKLMSLPGTECVCCSGEEEEESEDDAPFGRCLDDLRPGGPPGGSAPPQTAANLAGPATTSQQQQQQQEEGYEEQQQGHRQRQQQAQLEASKRAQQEQQGVGAARGSLEAPSTPLASASQRATPSLEQQQPLKDMEFEDGPAAAAAAALAQAERLLIEQQWVEPGPASAERLPWAAMEAAVASVPAADEPLPATVAGRPPPAVAEAAAEMAAAAAGALYGPAPGQPAAAVAAEAAKMAAAAAVASFESPKKASAGTEGLRYRSKGKLSEPGTSSGEFEVSPFGAEKGGKGGPPHHKQQQQKYPDLEPCGSTSSEGYAEEEDPKAAAKRARSALSAAALRQGLLLTFRDPAVENRFRQEQAQDLCKMDLLFHLVYLVAFACTAALDPPGVLGVATNIWLAWVLALPAVTIATCTEWVTRRYVRWRTWLLIPVTLLHMLHYRFAAAPALLQVLPTTALRKLPWLLRCTGAEALLVFPLGNKMPFSVFLPTQLASMLLMLTLLPGPCQVLLPLLSCNPGCLPAGWGVRCGAALLGAGFVLPTCAVYFGESRARRHFASTVQAM